MESVERVARTDTGLSAELRSAVVRLRRRLAAERQPENDLSMTSMTVLAALHRGGPRTIGELAALERVRPPSMTRTVTCLEDAGMVARREHPTDRRQVVVEATDRGREVLLADRRRRDAWLSQRLAALTPDERDVLRRAVPLLDRLAQED